MKAAITEHDAGEGVVILGDALLDQVAHDNQEQETERFDRGELTSPIARVTMKMKAKAKAARSTRSMVRPDGQGTADDGDALRAVVELDVRGAVADVGWGFAWNEKNAMNDPPAGTAPNWKLARPPVVVS